jgi:phosphoglycolate phosphatase-like HAD superfamily hydrolase
LTIRAWLFDLDGTLLSSVERFHAAYCSALSAFGHAEVDEPGFLARYRSGELVTSLELPPEAADRFWRRLMETFVSRRDLASPLPGAAAALAQLAERGDAVALVTGRACSEDALRTELQEHGLDAYFAALATLGEPSRLRLSAGGAITKTDLFSRTCADLGVDPGVAALVTDWPAELEQGLEFGFALCVGVLTGGYRRRDFRSDPRVRTVADLTEFPALLASLDDAPAKVSA